MKLHAIQQLFLLLIVIVTATPTSFHHHHHGPIRRASPSSPSSSSSSPSLDASTNTNTNSNLTLPIAAAWLYMTDDTNYQTIPKQWSSIKFHEIDLLYVGPAGIQSDGTFNLYTSNTTGPLATRFKWVVKTARAQNPDIKIIISQWYSSTPDVWGSDWSVLNSTQSIDKYADSVAKFIKTWSSVSGGIDGFDVDYETNNIGRNAPTIFGQVRDRLDRLSRKSTNGRKFYVTVSPVVVSYLTDSLPYIDYVNMQTYGGSYYTLTPQRLLGIGFQPQQLLYGICPETDCETKTVAEVEQAYGQYGLAGVHLWRLNSDNYVQELKAQKRIYNFLYPDQDE